MCCASAVTSPREADTERFDDILGLTVASDQGGGVLEARERLAQLLARADGELREHLGRCYSTVAG